MLEAPHINVRSRGDPLDRGTQEVLRAKLQELDKMKRRRGESREIR